MQVEPRTERLFEARAPELLPALAQEPDGLKVMRREPFSQACVKLEGGLCGIHREYGADFLSDACYFYPRVTRRIGQMNMMSAVLSCPEVARLAFADDDTFAIEKTELPRLPETVRDYLPHGMETQEALTIHRFFLEKALEEENPFFTFLRLCSVVRSLERINAADRLGALIMYWNLSAAGLPAPEPKPEDAFNLTQALLGLSVSTGKPMPVNLRPVIEALLSALSITIDPATMAMRTGEDAYPRYLKLMETWKRAEPDWQDFFRRWMAAQLSVNLFPFAGLGDTAEERAVILGVRFATLRLSLACLYAREALSRDAAIAAVQGLAKIFDHLGTSAFSLAIYKEADWNRESRLRALLET